MRVIRIGWMCAALVVGVLVSHPGAQQPPAPDPLAARVDPYVDKQRVIVMTDIANEPDDQMSMVRFLVYSNQFDVEGLIATTSTWMKNKVRPDVIQTLIDAYAQVLPKLLQHQPGFPSADSLKAVVVVGPARLRHGGRGARQMSAGAELIIQAAEKADARPLWVLAWGGTNTLAQALLQARATKTPAELDALVAKLRVYSISDQDDAGPWIRREFPGAALHRPAVDARRRPVCLRDMDRHQRRPLLQERAGRRLHDVHRRVGQRQHPQQGTARQAVSGPHAASTRATRRRFSA